MNYIEHENLLNINQPGFRANDSGINQLISITHEIYRAFNCNPSLKVRGIFLELFKAFDKFWHQGLLFKLESFGIRGKLLNLLEDYLSNRFQRVLLNGKESIWLPIKAGVPQGSMLGPLLFLIYINDLPDGLNSVAKLFVDDTSLFSIVQDPNESAKSLNVDYSVISQWAYQWKMFFNSDPKKIGHEVVFSGKNNEESHPSVFYDNIEVSRTDSQKHLGLVLDNKLTFKKRIKDRLNKTYFGVGKIKRLRDILPRDSLVTIYKSFIRPHLDYGDVIYDQRNNDSFSDKIEQLQYKVCLAITGAIQGTSRKCRCNELGLERWCRKLCATHELLSSQCPKYLFNIIPSSERFYDTPKKQRPFLNCRTDCFKYSFFQILYLYGRNLRLKYKTRSLLQLSKANFSLL